MTEGERHFGARGLRDVFASYGRFGGGDVDDLGLLVEVTEGSADLESLPAARLKLLSGELVAVLPVEEALVFHEQPGPRLSIGEIAVVEIDSDTGMFVFSDTNSESCHVLVTSDQGRLVDHVIGHVLRCGDAFAPQAVSGAIWSLVGCTVEDVERHLVLQTLRRCQGNRTHAAQILGISVRTLRNKLRGYWLADAAANTGS